jgi:hypothetical protein
MIYTLKKYDENPNIAYLEKQCGQIDHSRYDILIINKIRTKSTNKPKINGQSNNRTTYILRLVVSAISIIRSANVNALDTILRHVHNPCMPTIHACLSLGSLKTCNGFESLPPKFQRVAEQESCRRCEEVGRASSALRKKSSSNSSLLQHHFLV